MTRIKTPAEFILMMVGPEGPYSLRFVPDPNDEWEGTIDVQFPSETTSWPVEAVHDDANGRQIEGMAGIKEWNDYYWFSLWLDAVPPRIEYWGNQIIWRIDYQAVS